MKAWLVREKLIALIQSATDGCATFWAGLIADNLIANGVTVQQWIPVTERLPEEDTRVLVYLRDGYDGMVVIAVETKAVP